jgi:hypothetical protein
MNEAAPVAQMQRWQRMAWGCFGSGFTILLLVVFIERPRAVEAWWIAWIFWSGVSFGSLVILLLHNLTGGAWGVPARPVAEAAAMTLPLMALLFLPTLFFLGDLFPWAGPHAALGPHKHAYLTPAGFGIRGVTCLAVLSGFTVLLGLWQRPAFLRRPPSRSAALGAVAVIIYFALMLFASTDWVASLSPGWYSTMFVVIFAVDHFLSALALIVFLITRLQHPAAEVKQLHDLGNLIFTFVFFWAYVTFSQFLIIWSGNLPREISWYLQRSSGGWPQVIVLLAVIQFGVPFVLLLSRATKRSAVMLGPVAALVFCASAVHTWWLIAPSFQTSGVRIPYAELAALIGMGGLWAAGFLRFFKQQRPQQVDVAPVEAAYG